jgi:hypothetical protein
MYWIWTFIHLNKSLGKRLLRKGLESIQEYLPQDIYETWKSAYGRIEAKICR